MLTLVAPALPCASYVWGSGHTPETNPAAKGWRFAFTHKDGPLLIGQKGVVGCATVRKLGDDRWDVAIYWDTPEFVVAEFKLGHGVDAAYQQICDTAGYGLLVTRLVEEYRTMMRS